MGSLRKVIFGYGDDEGNNDFVGEVETDKSNRQVDNIVKKALRDNGFKAEKENLTEDTRGSSSSLRARYNNRDHSTFRTRVQDVVDRNEDDEDTYDRESDLSDYEPIDEREPDGESDGDADFEPSVADIKGHGSQGQSPKRFRFW